MKKRIKYSRGLRIVMMAICLLALGFGSFAQGSAAQAQPVKKINATPVSNTGNTKPAPWEKQPIHPGKNKTTGVASTNAAPAQAQTIQHK